VSYRVEPLAAGHDLDVFDCGHDALTDWLQQHARNATGHGTRTYLLVEEATGAVAGHFAIAPYMVERDTAPPGVGRGSQSASPRSSSPSSPCVAICTAKGSAPSCWYTPSLQSSRPLAQLADDLS
jgi:hypothetical protein